MDAIRTSREAGTVMLSPAVEKALKDLRSFMFENVYHNPVAKGQESKAKDMLQRLFEFYYKNTRRSSTKHFILHITIRTCTYISCQKARRNL